MHKKKKQKQNRSKKVIAGCIYDLKTKADVPFVLRPNKWVSLKSSFPFSVFCSQFKKIEIKDASLRLRGFKKFKIKPFRVIESSSW